MFPTVRALAREDEEEASGNTKNISLKNTSYNAGVLVWRNMPAEKRERMRLYEAECLQTLKIYLHMQYGGQDTQVSWPL